MSGKVARVGSDTRTIAEAGRGNLSGAPVTLSLLVDWHGLVTWQGTDSIRVFGDNRDRVVGHGHPSDLVGPVREGIERACDEGRGVTVDLPHGSAVIEPAGSGALVRWDWTPTGPTLYLARLLSDALHSALRSRPELARDARYRTLLEAELRQGLRGLEASLRSSRAPRPGRPVVRSAVLSAPTAPRRVRRSQRHGDPRRSR
jgi:hypothetical protein